jgi:hypothetical protein
MNDWKVGDTQILSNNPNFTLSVKRLEDKKISNKFDVEYFKFKVKIESIKKSEHLILNDGNVDNVRKTLMIIFKKVKNSFKKRNGPAYIQLNLSFDGLKKTFLKSGITPLFDKHSNNIVYWLINQLDQVEQSSENLVFSNNFFCDFIVIKTNQPEGKFDILLKSKYKSITSKANYIISKEMKLNIFFIDLIKLGFIDMKLFFNEMYIDDDASCQLISIYFGILYQENNCDLKKTISHIQQNYNNAFSFQESFINNYKIFDYKYLKTKTITFVLCHLSKKIKKDILVFSNCSQNTLKLIYSTKNYTSYLPIKVLFNNNHSVFICDNKNLQKKRCVFCDFCQKSFANIKAHKCQRKKCKNCNLYLQHLNEPGVEKVCYANYVKNTNFQCYACNKIIENTECVLRHKAMSKSSCTKLFFCNKCKTHYSHQLLHVCGEKFCKKCFSIHKPQLFCAIKYKKKKVFKTSVFLCDIKFDKNEKYSISVCEINHDEYIKVYRFIKEHQFYYEILISKENYETKKEVKHTYFSNLEIESIMQELEIVNLCPIFLVDKTSFKFILDTIDLSTFNTISKDKSVYKISSKYYSISTFDQYIDFDKVYILRNLTINVCPLYLIEPTLLNALTMKDCLKNITIENFMHEYKHSDLKMFEYINSYKYEIDLIQEERKIDFYRKSSISTLIVYYDSLKKIEILLKSLANKMDIKLGKNINTFECLFHFSSFSAAIFSIFLSSLEHQKLPTLPSCVPGNIMNTSKYEISFCKVLNNYHQRMCSKHSIKSYINNDGRQYQNGKYTADWYCKECKIAIFIEGNFKFICNKHENSVKHVFKNKNRILLSKRGKEKRLEFIQCTKNEIDNVFVVGQCCILKNQYNDDFKMSNLYYTTFGKDVINELNNYNKSEYVRMNYQNAIQPAFTVNLKDSFKSDGISKATKFDINSAYLSVLTQADFKLPKSNIPDVSLVNIEANNFFHKLDINDNNFGFIKAFIIKKDRYKLSFIPYRSKKHGIIYSHCFQCKIKNQSIENCDHSENERGFFTEGYLSDFLYMKKLGYNIKVTQLIYFDSIHNEQLHYLAEELMSFRKSDCKFTRKMSKQAALIGLGRFALNIGKHGINHLDVIDNNQHLCLTIENNDIENLDFCENYVICHVKNKINNYENAKLSSRLNCSSMMFGTVSNYVRREIFELYRFIEKQNSNIEILRIDTDSVIIKCPKIKDFECFEEYKKISQFKYKVEMDNIKLLINYGTKSHYYENDKMKVLTVTGLRLSTYDRHYLQYKFIN